MMSCVKALREKYPHDTLRILVAKRNSGSFTYDGIELGGERVCQEIEDEIESLARKGQHIKKLSLVGYSLGGLVSRYAIGLLYSKGWFEKVEPVVCILPEIRNPVTNKLRRTLQPLQLLISAYVLH